MIMIICRIMLVRIPKIIITRKIIDIHSHLGGKRGPKLSLSQFSIQYENKDF